SSPSQVHLAGIDPPGANAEEEMVNAMTWLRARGCPRFYRGRRRGEARNPRGEWGWGVGVRASNYRHRLSSRARLTMRQSRRLLRAVPVAGALVAGATLLAQRGESAPERNIDNQPRPAELKPAVRLPISQVILFNSGVGHFTRAGDVEGDARVDLTFPETDINDLIKSMTLRDFSPNGRVAAVTYDSHDPIDRTLARFAINLNSNPSFAQILQQARGEQVEVTLVNNASQPGNLTGKIIGVEQQPQPSKEGPPVLTSVLNLWCAEGVRAIKLTEVQKLRFANP